MAKAIEIHVDIIQYNSNVSPQYIGISQNLCSIIHQHLKTENKIWHAHPVWFIDGNPIVGYSEQKAGIRLMFWSGKSFEEPLLIPGKKFEDASIIYTEASQINVTDLKRWLKKSRTIQWDYKNIVKRKGVLVKL